MDQESIVLDVDPRSVLAAIKQANQAVEGWEKGTVGAGDKMQKSLERMAEMLLKVNDRSRSSMERVTQSIEKQAAAYGKTGIERLIAERDRLIKKLGDEQGMVDRVTAAYAKMIAAESEKSGGSWQAMGRNIEEFIRDPIVASKGAVTELSEKLGPMGKALAGGAAALVAVAAAGWEAAKSLGEYGVRIKDAELRTGMTAKEVGQFSFAAKAVGQDISIVERLMRGLSHAADDTSTEGEKARITLRAMGIDFHTATGEMKPTSEILMEISEGLNKLPEGLQRDAAAMDLFKRVGVEAIPFMTELNENLRLAHEQGFGPTEDDVRRFTEYQREVAVLETKWDALVRKFKEGIVITVSWVGKGVDWFLNNIGTAGDEERRRKGEEQSLREQEEIRALGGVTKMSRSEHRRQMAEMNRRAPEIMKNREAIERQIEGLWQERTRLIGDFGILQAVAPTHEEEDKIKRAQEIQAKAEQLQKMLDDASEAMRRKDLHEGKAEVDRLRARFFGTREGMEKAHADAKKDVERLQRDLLEPDKPLTKTQALNLGTELRAAQSTEARTKAVLDAMAKGDEQVREFRRQAAAFERKGEEAELDAIGKIYYERDQLLKQAERVKATEVEIAAIRKAADDQASVLFEKQAQQAVERERKRDAEIKKIHDKEWEEIYKGLAARTKQMIEDFKRRVAEARAALAWSDEQIFGRMRAEGSHAERVIGILGKGGDELDTLRQQLAVRRAVRDQELAIKEQHEAIYDIDRERFIAEMQNLQDRYEYEDKILELKRKEFDEVERTAQSLAHTLLTKPGEFGKQLVSTLHEAILKPITEGIASLAARALTPLIYGSDGQGGIAGIFKGVFGRQDPMKSAMDLNTAVTVQNSMAVASLTAVIATLMGASAPAIAAPTSMPGISIPAISAPAVAGPAATGASSLPVPMPILPGLALPGISAASGSEQFSAILKAAIGGGSTGVAGSGTASWASNLRASWNSLKSFAGFGNMVTDSQGTRWVTAGGQYIPLDSIGGWATAVGRSPAAGMAGSMLAMQGLLGSGAGSWRGVMEGTAGGAMLGFQAGGPLGAAIGASLGFEIGAFEKLFGVESPENEAKRLVKQLYSINIDAQMAKQIVALAQQKYAGHVSIAVRDPDVRKMLMLYSEGTGQKMPLSASTPQSASLVEMGGKLYQQATYVNGAPYTFQSNLPVLGGYATGTYPSPGPMMLQVNVQGQGAAQFVAGQVVTPEFVQAQWSSAAAGSNGRLQNSAVIQQPGLVVA